MTTTSTTPLHLNDRPGAAVQMLRRRNHDDMNDPMVLGGYVQCGVIVLIFVVRYFIDVLFTPRFVDEFCFWISQNVCLHLRAALISNRKTFLCSALLSLYPICTRRTLNAILRTVVLRALQSQ